MRIHLLWALLCVGAVLTGGQAVAAGAIPSGGQFVAGQGAIAGGRSSLTVTQSSSHGIIDWKSFSIGAANSVQFDNGAGATLNRVTGGNLSQIDGGLSATGSVYLINPQGIVVGPGGKVVTNGSFVASTRDISNSDFMAGGAMTASGNSEGGVTNAGVITSNTGDAILVGRTVTNSGTLSAPSGSASLAAGDEVVLQSVGGDGRISVSAGHGAVTNSGAIKAAQAALSSGGDIYGMVENNGAIAATGTATIAGHVWLTGGGTAQISGSISATNADGSGGAVTVRASDIDLPGIIDASATAAGKVGGTVSAIATDTITVSGIIKAEGGTGGHGGKVETSGAHVHVSDGATIDTLALGGTAGTWLLDPNDFTIAASGGDITGATLSTNLATGNVVISSSSGATSGNGDIFVNDAVSWSSNHRLTLNAVRNIDFNADVTATGTSGKLTLTYGGAENFSAGDSITLSGASAALTINSTSYTLLQTIGDVQGISGDLTGHYALAQDIDASATVGWNSGAGFVPLGDGGTSFTGTFDGLGHTISDLFIDNTTALYVGLFGNANGPTIENVGLVGGSVSGGDSADVGGLVGHVNSGTISNAYTTGDVSGGTEANVGGLAGNLFHDTVSDSYATGTVSGGDSANVGGLVGYEDSSISDTYATGTVAGGVGAFVGGLIGYIDSLTISNSYAIGAVSGGTNAYVGALAGANYGTISDSYATGAVSGGTHLGGLLGYNDGTITDSYWDTDTTGQSAAVGSTGLSSSVTVTGLATSSARTQSNYSALDFTNTWFMIDGETRPFLRSEYSTTITNSHQLQLMAMDPTADYKLANDIDLSGEFTANSNGNYPGMWGADGFVPVGDSLTNFTGSFDGQNHTITGLKIDDSTDDALGLFGVADSVTIENVGLSGGSVTGISFSDTGALAGDVLGASTISNDWSSASVESNGSVGGLVGNIQGTSTITGSYATGDVTLDSGGTYGGGLVGIMGTTSSVTGSYATGDVSGSDSANLGGLVGHTGGSATISDDYATGSVSGGDSGYVGGLVGRASGGISGSYATGMVTAGDAYDVGGLAGSSGTSIADSHATGSVTFTGNGNGGGLAGEAYGTISDSYASGAVSGGSLAILGGLVGTSEYGNTITNTYATGAVTGDSSEYVGGLVGLSQASGNAISDSYAAGAVSDSGSGAILGGLVADNGATLSDNYFDTDTTGQSDGVGAGTSGGTAKTTAELTAGLPSGFNSAVWDNLSDTTTPYLSALTTSGSEPVYFGSDSADIFNLLFDVDQLQAISADLSANYALANDIDASATSGWNSGAGFIPLGDGSGVPDSTFSGIFNGLGHTISDLFINDTTDNEVGLFGYALDATIENVGLVGGSITATNAEETGGLAGEADHSTISNAYATVTVSGSSDVGGLVGINDNGTSITDSHAMGAVTATGNSIGGLVGDNDGDSSVTDSYATGAVSGDGNAVGGLVGYNNGTITNSYATGEVSGSDYVGGLAGQNIYNGTITDSYATGAVSGSDYIGGLMGDNSAMVTDSYATGQVSGGTGATLGGVTGSNSGTITHVYFDKNTTGQSVGVGSGSAGGAARTTRQLTAALPAGFSSSVWDNVDDQTTPYLKALTANPQPVHIGSDSSDLFNLIFTLDQLQAINDGLSANYALANDIDASATSGWNSGAGFVPLGDLSTQFSGIFDGLGNTVSDLTVNASSTAFVGLFGYAAGATIENIGIEGGSITSSEIGAIAGALAGEADTTTISNAHATAAITTTTEGEGGGLIGSLQNGSLAEFYATGTVMGADSATVGGLVGAVGGGATTLTDDYATGAVSGGTYAHVGGLVGYDSSTATTSRVYATGTVSGGASAYVGGLVGYNNAGTIIDAYATGAVSGSGTNDKLGGLVGYSSGTGSAITDAYATGAVSGGGAGTEVGGLVGQNDSTDTITNGYWDTDTGGSASQGVGLDNNSQFVIGFNTNGLTAHLPSGFSSAVWGNVGNQTTPYLLALTSNPQTVYIGADSATAPFQLLFDIDQVQAISDDLSANYALAGDIDASATSSWNAGAGFVPLGDDSTKFTGIFDGLGNTIDDLTIDNSTDSYVGLFGYANGATIENVGLVGGLVTGTDLVGALAGEAYGGTITGAYSTATVSGGYGTTVGGLVGYGLGSITNSYTTGAVTGGVNAVVGGLVAVNSGTITDAYATGAVSGGDGSQAGGLVARNYSSIITAYATGAVTGGDSAEVGGLVAYNTNSITGSYATGAVTGGDSADVGGLVGKNDGGIVEKSYATGDVSAGDVGALAGGLVGYNIGTVENAYATGAVMAGTAASGTNDYAGGLAGYNDPTGSISYAYSTGAVTSSDSGASIGGAIAYNESSGTVVDTYWDTETSGLSSSGAGTAKTTAELTAALPAGFDSAVWDNVGNQTTPYLKALTSNPQIVYIGSDSADTFNLLFNIDQLQAISGDLSANYALASDIDASATSGWNSGAGFVPLGNGSTPFSGVFDGLGNTITDLFIDDATDEYVGLFGYASGATIENVGLVGGSVTGGVDGAYIGELVGVDYSDTITDSYATGTVIGGDNAYVGGLVGAADVGTIDGSYATGTVSGGSSAFVGGLAGIAEHGTIDGSYATGTVSGGNSAYVGGLVGDSYFETVSDSHATGAVGGGDASYSGGLAGYNLSGTISKSYATGAVSGGSNGPSGGLVGESDGAISESYATGTVVGGDSASVGGLVGYSFGAISNSYAMGAVSSGQYGPAGGLAGGNDGGTITDSYATGAVSGGYADGLVAVNQNGGTVTHSYWDTQTSGQSSSVGGTGLTTVQLQATLRSGFHSGTWSIVAGESFPYLNWQFSGTPEPVSGMALDGYGGSAVSGATINAIADGTALGTASSGANGYYYFLLAPDTLENAGGSVLVYRAGSGGAGFEDGASGSVSGLDLYSDYLHIVTPATTYSAVSSDLSGAVGGDGTVQSILGGLGSLDIDATASGTFDINAAIDESGTVRLDAAGAISEGGSGAITASTLTGSSHGAVTLSAANTIADMGAFTTANNAFHLTDAHGLTLTGAVNAGTGNLALTTTGSRHNLVVDQALTGHVVTLTSAARILSNSGARSRLRR